MKRVLSAVLCLFCFFLPLEGLAQETESYPVHPLIVPDAPVALLETPDRFFNLLLLGIDYGDDGYRGSGSKDTFENCHTDAVIVAALNLTTRQLALVSIPRDTLVYVPGVRGIYKFNGAINCSQNTQEGLLRASQAASRILGGIRIDAYCAVDLNAMIAIGDAIGGVDFELEMTYSHLGRTYEKGLQHLDGRGIADYLRARTNASVNANDIGRTGRQRELIQAVFEKVLSSADVLTTLLNLLTDKDTNFFTSLTSMQVLSLVPYALEQRFQGLASYVVDGAYRSGMKSWNFTFTDQDARRNVIQSVWGVTVPDLPYVSKKYTDWLYDSGFKQLRVITVSEQVLKACQNPADEQQAEARDTLLEAHQAACDAFTKASYTLGGKDKSALGRAITALKKAADTAAKRFDYTDYNFYTGKYWYADPMINQYELDWR